MHQSNTARLIKVLVWGLSTLVFLLIGGEPGNIDAPALRAQSPGGNPAHDWEVLPGFSVAVDSTGFTLPTSIATVPEPGAAPNDPLYFVAELGGTVKVVTNDRSVHAFAEDFFALNPTDKSRFVTRQIGMAGICLDPDNGYVFVTFTYSETPNILRNNIVRFESKPTTFSLQPTGQQAFTKIFSSYMANPSHMIGPCQVDDGMLYVAVGDSFQPAQSQENDSILGKILRLTFEGKPVEQNPFRQDDDLTRGQNYVFAKGFRNPFGLWVEHGEVFVADNGPHIDRFLRVEGGGNYLWDGTDDSFNLRSEVLLVPNHGVVQMDRYPRDSNVFPEAFANMFFLTVPGNIARDPAPENRQPPTVLTIEYDLNNSALQGPAKEFLRFNGDYSQLLVGLAFGKDGLYFAPFDEDPTGTSGIYRVAYNPEDNNQPVLRASTDPLELVIQKGCRSCHMIRGDGGTVGPDLESSALVARLSDDLNSSDYTLSVEEINELDSAPFARYRSARQEVLDAEGIDKVRTWIKYRIQEPRFDRSSSAMPNLGIGPEEAEIIADFLVEGADSESRDPIRKLFDRLSGESIGRKDLALFFVIGSVGGAIGTILLVSVVVWIIRRRSHSD